MDPNTVYLEPSADGGAFVFVGSRLVGYQSEAAEAARLFPRAKVLYRTPGGYEVCDNATAIETLSEIAGACRND